MKSTTYVKYLSLFIGIFLLYHLLIWIFFASKIFGLNSNTVIGDLARMSYQIDMLSPRELKYTLSKSFLYKNTYKNQKVDIITIGDSFSHGGGAGINSYYQDYLASYYNLHVLNINPEDSKNFFDTIIGLYNSGYLQKIKPKIIILQSVERILPHRFSTNLDLKKSNIKKPTISSKTLSIKHLDVKIISTANYKIPYFYFMYHFKENAKKDVYKLDLTKKLFSLEKNKILIFHDDIKNIPQFTKENILKMNDNFNKIAKLLSTLNIKLFIMPTADKYDMYYDYLKNNKHPKNPFFELIRPLKKDYYFVDTKKILLPLLQNGVKDVYHVDDTHWSYKASEAIAKDKVFADVLKGNN